MVRGRRVGTNVRATFGGNLVLDRINEDEGSLAGICLGSVNWGGAYAAGTDEVPNIRYAARISAYAESAFVGINNMPTYLAFFTDTVGAEGGDSTNDPGTERFRVSSGGNFAIGHDFDITPAMNRTFSVYTRSATSIVAVFRSDQATNGSGISFMDASTTADTTVGIRAIANALDLRSGGATRVRIASDGTVTGLFSGAGVTRANSKFEVVTTLPGTPDPDTIYFVTT